MNNFFELGVEVKDKVTGWRGIVISRIEYLNGCVQYGVKKKATSKDTELKGAEYIDSQQLVQVGLGVTKKEKTPARVGGPMGKDCPE